MLAVARATLSSLALVLGAVRPVLWLMGVSLALYGLLRLWECFGDRRAAVAYVIAGCALMAAGCG